MKLDYGVVIAMIAALIFYLRLIILQRQRVKRYQVYQQQKKAMSQKSQGKKSGKQAPTQSEPSITNQLGFKITNGYLLGFAILVMILAAVVGGTNLVNPQIRSFWWIPFVIGIFILNTCIR